MIDDRPAHSTLNRRKDPIGIAEANFGLGRVHIDVDILGRNPDHQHGNRVAAAHQQRVIGLHDGIRQAGVLNPAAVDEQMNTRPVGAVQVGRRGETPDVDIGMFTGIVLDLDHVFERVQAEHRRNHVDQLAAAVRPEDLAPILHQHKAHMRVRQGIAHHDIRDLPVLGTLSFEKF